MPQALTPIIVFAVAVGLTPILVTIPPRRVVQQMVATRSRQLVTAVVGRNSDR